MEDLLNKWELSELIPIFQEQKITLNTMLDMPEEIIYKIIKLTGPAFEFLSKRKTYLETSIELLESVKNVPHPNSDNNLNIVDETQISEDIVEKNVQNLDTDAIVIEIPTFNEVQKGKILQHLLTKSVNGLCISQFSVLSHKQRQQLCAIIIDALLLPNIHRTVKANEFLFWANEIVALFKNEEISTYYVPYNHEKKKNPTSGKLWDRYTYIKRDIKIAFRKENVVNEVRIADAVSESESDLLNELKNVNIEDHNTIKDLWAKTLTLRKKYRESDSYFETFPFLKHPIGSTLIEIDYRLLNLSKPDIFDSKSKTISKPIVETFKGKRSCQAVIRDSGDASDEIKALRMLPFLLRPPTIKIKGQNGWKASFEEQSSGFILWVNRLSDVEEALQEREQFLRRTKLQNQPFVLAVGLSDDIQAAYSVIHNIKYQFTDVLRAVDFTFKSFYALELEYPKQSEIIWNFFAKCIFDLKEYKRYLSIDTLITDLKNSSYHNSDDL